MFVQSHLDIIFDCFTGDSNGIYVMIEKLYSLWGDVFEIWSLYGAGYYNHDFWSMMLCTSGDRYARVNKNPSAWNFLSPKPEVTCGTVAIIIWVILLSPYLRIHAVSLSSIHYNQSHRIYINRRRQYICLIWN